MTRRISEQRRRRLTKAERKAFVRQIRNLVKTTGKFEREKVDQAIDLMNRARTDVMNRLARLRRDSIAGTQARDVKIALERNMAEFEAEAKLLMRKAQTDVASLTRELTDQLVLTQGESAPLFDIPRELIENATGRTADLIRSLSQRHIGLASDIINRGVLTGKSTFLVGRELSKAFGKSTAQMETIARTEMLGISSQVQQAQMNQLAKDVPRLRKQWVTVLDERTRSGHREAHLQTVPHDKPFKVAAERGGRKEELMFPRDPAGSPGTIINCRCASIVEFGAVEEPEPPFTTEELPPIAEPLKGLGSKVAKDLRKFSF